MRRRSAGAALLIGASLTALGGGTATAEGPCDFGGPVSERMVLAPRAGTFYSVDALNPDVVRTRHGFRLYFSGNDRRSDAGFWRTGLARSSSPTGPFRVDAAVQLGFLNGGTTRFAGRWYHAASVTAAAGSGPPRMYRSRDGLAWRPLLDIPLPPTGAWDRIRSDFHLVPRARGVDVYYAGRPGAGGADLGLLRYRAGRVDDGEMVLARAPGWDALDLGEPAIFRARGREYLLYGGLRASGEPRRIGLAHRTAAGWRRCPRPFIDVSERYPQNAIDPEPLVVRRRLYVFFGGGDRPSLGGDMRGRIWVREYRF